MKTVEWDEMATFQMDTANLGYHLVRIWRQVIDSHYVFACKGCGFAVSGDKWGRFPNGRLICPDCHKSKGYTRSPQRFGIMGFIGESEATIKVPLIGSLRENR